MLDPYGAYERTYGPGGRPRPVGPVRRVLARIPPRLALGVFLACWTATQGWMVLAWADGEPTPVFITHWLALPALAGVLVGWWRGGVAGALAGGVAGALVALANALVLLALGNGWSWALLSIIGWLAFMLGLVAGALGAVVHPPDPP